MKKVISFVHGYHNLTKSLHDKPRPCLKIIERNKVQNYSYIFLRNKDDFIKTDIEIAGEMPSKNVKNFKKLPRFGFTGLASKKNKIYCGSWNSIYEIDSSNLELKKIISNRLMSDIHGICVSKKYIIFTLTCKDTVVFTDFNGKIINFFTINKDLKVSKDKKILKTDWRFASKQFRGSTGHFHFNYVTIKNNNELWLTARNMNAFVIVNLKTLKVTLKTMNLFTPALVHDGVHHNKKIYLTSIDGKIIIAKDGHKNEKQRNEEKINNVENYNRGLIIDLIRLNKDLIGKDPNWCRGIDVSKNRAHLTIDGRYDTKLQFSYIEIDLKRKKLINKINFDWKDIDNNKRKLRYCAGFDVILIK